MGHPEEAMSRLSSKRETTTKLALDRTDRKRPVRLVGVGGSIAFSWVIVLSIHYSDTITTTTCPQAK